MADGDTVFRSKVWELLVKAMTAKSLHYRLWRLHEAELAESFDAADWKETETGREAKFYKLTRKGRAQLDAESASWERLTEAVGLILRMSEEGAK